jgi:hypothetical protein
MSRAVWIAFVLGMAITAVQAQDAAPVNTIPANWIAITAGKAFSLRAPPGTRFRPEQGIDSFVSGFDGPGFTMTFDYGVYSNPLEDLKADPQFTTEQAGIDGRLALIVEGPGHNQFGCKQWLVALHTMRTSAGMFDRENTLTMGACVKDAAAAPQIKAIFRTIRFLH